MRFEIDYTFEDFAQAQRANWRRHRVRTFVIYGALVLLVLVIALANRGRYREPGFWVLPGLTALLLVLTPALNRAWLWHSWRRDPRRTRRAAVGLSAEGVSVLTADAASQLQWTAFTHYVETKGMFLLYLGPSTFLCLPKRAIGGEPEAAAVRDLLVHWVGRTCYAPSAAGFPVGPAIGPSPPPGDVRP